MPIDSVATLIQLLAKSRLLEPSQLDEINRELQPRITEPRLLARALLERNWLTSLQINYLFQGRGADLLLGSYILLERLGEGLMGQVYKARHQHLKRTAALKIFREELLAREIAVERFYHEIQATSSLSHPNIVHAYDAGPVGRTHFFAMEYVRGIDLEKMVQRSGPPPVDRACDFMSQAAMGLQHACERGLLHQDFKPANLLVTRSREQRDGPGASSEALSSKTFSEGLVKIRNLGLTPLQRGPDDSSTEGGGNSGIFLGAADFRAPELAQANAPADVRAELYSFGCTFYYVLTGQVPFPGGEVSDKLRRHQTEEPVPVESMRAEVPPELAAIVRRLMAKSPEERFQGPAEVAAALGALYNTAPSSAPKAPTGGITTASVLRRTGLLLGLTSAPAEPASPLRQRQAAEKRRWLKRNLIGALVLLVLLAAFLGLLLRGSRTAPPPDAAQEAWKQLQARAEDPSVDPIQLRSALLSFQRIYPGQASQAAALLTSLSSPLDNLKSPPPGERFAWQPAELVAVLGSHRGRHWGNVEAVAFSSDGKRLASGGHDKFVRVWDAATLEERFALPHNGLVIALAFAPDGRTLAASGSDGSIRLWDVILGTPARPAELKGHKGIGHGLAFAAVGKKLAVVSSDKTVRLWDLAAADPSKPLVLGAPGLEANAVAFTADGSTVATGGGDHVIRIWDAASGKLKEPLKGHSQGIQTLAFSPDGKTLVSGSKDKTMRLWKLEGGKAVEKWTITHGHHVLAVAFAPDGKTIASGCQDSTIKLWNAAGDKAVQQATLANHTGAVQALAFSPDGKTLASGSSDSTVRLWTVAGPHSREQLALHGHTSAVTAMAFAADLKTLASGSADRTARLWDLTLFEPKERSILRGHTGTLDIVTFTRDGKGLLTGDGHVRLWDLTVPDPKAEFVARVNAGMTGATAVAPNGMTLMTAGLTGQLTWWDSGTGRKRHEWPPFPGPVPSVVFAPDGRHVALGNSNGTIYILRLPSVTAKPK